MSSGCELLAEAAEDVLGHARQRERCDGIGLDVVLGALDGEHVREPDEPHLGGAVVGLSEVAEDAGSRRCRHDAAVALFAHQLPRRLRHVERAAKVDGDDRVEQVGVHVVERLVTQDAGVVDDDVDLAERIDCTLDDRRAALGRRDRVGVGDGLATGLADLVDDELGSALVGAGAVDGTAEIVHHDERTALGHHQCVLAPEAATGARDDRYLAVESEISHGRQR